MDSPTQKHLQEEFAKFVEAHELSTRPLQVQCSKLVSCFRDASLSAKFRASTLASLHNNIKVVWRSAPKSWLLFRACLSKKCKHTRFESWIVLVTPQNTFIRCGQSCEDKVRRQYHLGPNGNFLPEHKNAVFACLDSCASSQLQELGPLGRRLEKSLHDTK